MRCHTHLTRNTPRLIYVDTGWVWMMLRVVELLLVVWVRQQLAESHYMPSFTALLTTKAEAWPVRVASTHAMSLSRHTQHAMAQLRG